MTKLRKRILGIGCAALFAVSNVTVSLALPKSVGASADSSIQQHGSASAQSVALEAYGGSLEKNSVSLTDEGKFPQLPVPVREGYDFVGWFTKEVEVEYWGDDDSETWQALKNKYGSTTAGYKYLDGKSISWYNIAENPDPNYPDNAGYDWTNSRWIENSVGVQNATKGEWAKEGEKPEEGVTTLYAMYDPKNITVHWYNNGWNGSDDTDYVSTGRSSGFEYGGKFAYLPLDQWDPWSGSHTFKGWVDENGKKFEFDLNKKCQPLKNEYKPEKYNSVLRLYAIYDDVTAAKGSPKDAKFDRVVGNGGYFDPKASSYTFQAVFDSRYKIYPEIQWEIVEGEEFFDLMVSKDKTKATVSAKKECLDEMKENQQVHVRLTVGSQTYQYYAIASHNWNNGKILSGLWNRCTSPMEVEYTCTTCGEKKIREYEADGHRFTCYRSEATCTEDAVEERYCVVCGKTEREIKEGTALGHQWNTKTVKGCSGTIVTSICTVCGKCETKEDHVSNHSWNSFYTVDRAATCTTAGAKSIHCKNCSATKDSAVIPATGHNYRKTTHAATCTEGGYEESICISCRDRKVVVTSEPKGHTFTENTQTGCNGATYTVKTCKSCGAVETIGNKAALAHTPAKEYTVKTAPSCTKTGLKVRICTKCNTVLEQVTIPATGHSYQVTAHEATCTKEGYTVSICSVCGDSVTKITSAPKGHDYDIDVKVGCGGATFTTKTCKNCHEVITEGDLQALEHIAANDFVVEKAATCTEAGEQVIRCTKCNIVLKSEPIAATGHQYETTEYDATCTESGYTVSVCKLCGKIVREITAAPKGHDFACETEVGCSGTTFTTKVCKICNTVETVGDRKALEHSAAEDFAVESAAGCVEAGEKVLRCTKCNIILERVLIPATGHDYETTEFEATCTESGYTVSVCCHCGERVTKVVADPSGHEFEYKTETGCCGAEFTTKTCKHCGTVETKGDRSELDHVPGNYVVEKAPTCTETGESVLRCAKCKAVMDSVTLSVCEHSVCVNEYEATCTESGRRVSVCLNCGKTETEVISDPCGHEFECKTETGCRGAEFTTKTCVHCGTVETEGDREALEHCASETYVVDKAASCAEDGEKTLLCKDCGRVLERVTIPATGHEFHEKFYEANCTEGGYFERSCDKCGKKEIEVVKAPAGHIAGEAVMHAPTCHTDGEKSVYCEICGEQLETETLAADSTLHEWSDWETVLKEGTETRVRTCAVCGETEETCSVTPEVVEQEEVSVPPERTAGENVEHIALAENETNGANMVWLWIALGTVCGAALICVPTAIAIKRRR